MEMPAILVENISKQYHLGQREKYKALRDIVSEALRNPWRFFAPRKDKSDEQSFWALKNVSLQVKPGEVVGIIGPNGAGKSTLLKILSRITYPDKGQIKIFGRVGSLLEVGTGFHLELSGRENIYLNGAILGMKRLEIERKFDEIVEFSGIGKFIDTAVKHYSSGMYVRLAFAVAAHLEPEILLVDEVLAVGDAAFQKKCLGKMGQVASEGRTVVLVSHNMSSIGSLCQTVFWLDKGQLVMAGESEKVIAKYLESTSDTSQTTTVFKDDEKKDMCILSIRMTDTNDKSLHTVDMSQPFQVEVKYKIRKQISDGYIDVLLESSDGVTYLCKVRDTDQVTAGHIDRQPGTYVSKVEFPGNLLNAGFYKARIALVRHNLPVCDQAFSPTIELINCGSIESYKTNIPHKHRERGLLALKLRWDTRKE